MRICTYTSIGKHFLNIYIGLYLARAHASFKIFFLYCRLFSQNRINQIKPSACNGINMTGKKEIPGKMGHACNLILVKIN